MPTKSKPAPLGEVYNDILKNGTQHIEFHDIRNEHCAIIAHSQDRLWVGLAGIEMVLTKDQIISLAAHLNTWASTGRLE